MRTSLDKPGWRPSDMARPRVKLEHVPYRIASGKIRIGGVSYAVAAEIDGPGSGMCAGCSSRSPPARRRPSYWPWVVCSSLIRRWFPVTASWSGVSGPGW